MSDPFGYDFVVQTKDETWDVLVRNLRCPIGKWYVVKGVKIYGPFTMEVEAVEWRKNHPITTHDEWRILNMISNQSPHHILTISDPKESE